MPAELNFFDTYTLMAVQKRIVPKQTATFPRRRATSSAPTRC